MLGADAIGSKLVEVKEAVVAQTGGLVKMLGILATQTSMLKQIQEALTAEPKGDSPLVEALNRLLTVVESHGEILTRMEATLARIEVR